MAENGNRGPNDFRSRNGKKRREPPIIDASATEVPIDTAAPATHDTSVTDESETAKPSDSEASTAGEPVLFGSAMRDTAPRDAAPREGGPRDPAPWGTTSAVDEPLPATEPRAEPGTTSPDPVGTGAEPQADDAAASTAHREHQAADGSPVSRAPDDESPPRDTPPAHVTAAARSGAGALPGVLGVVCLVLLGVIAWLLYAPPRRADQDALAASVNDLKSKVAALEARPDPAQAQNQIQGSVGALDKRVAAADADRAAMAKTVAGLTGRLDAVAEQAETARADAAKATAAMAAKPADAAAVPANGDAAPPAAPAFATLGAVAALAARVDGLDKGLSTLSDDEGRTAKAVADLPKPVAPDFGPIDAKVAALDTRVAALDGKLNGSDARFNGFDAKVNGVDGKINGFDARVNGLDGRVNAIESRAEDAAAQATKLQGTVAGLPKVDLAPLQAASAALDGRVAKVESQLAATKDGARATEARAVGSADETKATSIALVGQSIESAIADGRSYAADLDALKALGAEPDAIAKLSPMAAKGAPSVASLKERWEATEADVLAALKPPADSGGSALDRFAASARNLVQVRRVGATSKGDDASAIVLEVDAALSAGDVPEALAAWNRLSAAGQDKSRDWAALAQGQADAAAAAQGLVARAIATLGRSKT